MIIVLIKGTLKENPLLRRVQALPEECYKSYYFCIHVEVVCG